jgi:hypothetical protein
MVSCTQYCNAASPLTRFRNQPVAPGGSHPLLHFNGPRKARTSACIYLTVWILTYVQTKLGCSCAEMGATVKLDLTSDVTHLIVGNIDTLKYRYVAKSREDVRVLHVDWIDAVRDDWMKGGDVDVPALEHKYRLPTFYGLRICLTGFEDRTSKTRHT